MADIVEIDPPPAFDVEVSVPGSKSITNRALICAALADGRSRLIGVSRSEDTKRLIQALRALGWRVEPHPPTDLVVEGTGGRVAAASAELDLGNAGTSLRFATAVAALGKGTFRIDGDARMRERPIAPLGEALRSLGAGVEYAGAHGFPPLIVRADGLAGGSVRIDARDSSQFLSALLMVGSCARGPIHVEISGRTSSRGYVAMTLGVMSAFGVRAESAPSGWRLTPSKYVPVEFRVEPDAAAAGYWFAMAAVTRGRSTVIGLGAACVQPEIGLLDDLQTMGARVDRQADRITVEGAPLRGIDADLNGRPDSVPALAVTAAFAEGPTRIRNVGHLRYKESDRLAALAHELGKLGARVIEHADGLDIEPPAQLRPALIETHRDHRIAMAFAVAGVRASGVRILDPNCVAKSYPNFWQALKHAGISVKWS